MPQYELNLRDYWQIIRKRQAILWVVLLAVLIATVIYTNMQKPLYQAVAVMQWIERRVISSQIRGGFEYYIPIRSGEQRHTQLRIMRSIPILEKVVKELGLAGEHASEGEIQRRTEALQGAVSTDVVTGTNVIKIFVTHGNPEVAAKVANKIAEVYIAENLKEKSKQSRSVREFIEKQLGDLSDKLKKSEEELANFKETEAPSGVGVGLQNRLGDLEARRQGLLQKYTDNHPDVKNIEEEITQVKEQLKAVPQKELVYNQLRREAEINSELYQSLKNKLEAARVAEAEEIEDVSLVERASIPGTPVSPNKRLNYFFGAVIGLMLGLSGIFLFEQLDTSIGTIEDVENYLKLPVLGVIPYLKTADEKEKGLIGLIAKFWPKEIKGEEKVLRLRKQLLIHYSSSSPAFEAYRILRTNIQTEVFKEKIERKMLLFSSSGPEEGKSISSSNLAIVMAQGGLRTLLIDADMRRPTVHNIFGIKKEPGLCNLLRETIEIEEAIRTFTDILIGEIGFNATLKIPGLDNLSILSAGSLPMLPTELLASPEMAALLQKLRGRFDIIIIDCPPVMAVADAVILASKTDGVILIYRVGKTAKSVLFRTKTQLVGSGVQVKGVVLNNMSPELEMRYGYYYHYKYYGKYYTTSPKKTPEI